MTVAKAGALQIAIWEIVREGASNPLNVASGDIFFSGGSEAGMLTLAQSYLTAIDGTGARAVGLFALNNDGRQDMLVQTAIPEPATWALMIGGFGLAGVALRRRRSAIA